MQCSDQEPVLDVKELIWLMFQPVSFVGIGSFYMILSNGYL